MTSKDFKKVARILKEVYSEIEKQALSEGVDIFSEEYKTLIDKARESVLAKTGFTLEEYRTIKDSYTLANKQKVNQQIETLNTKIEDIKSIPPPVILTVEDIKSIAHEVAKEYIKPPQITNQIVKEITKEVKIEQPKIIETIKVTRETYDAKPIEKKLSKLEEKIDNIKIPEIPKPLNINKLKTELKSEWNKDLKENINTLGMPDFRKLAMGLRTDIDRIETLQPLDAQLTSLAGLSYTGNALKVIRVNAGETDFELATVAGGSGLTQPQVMARLSIGF